MTQTEIERLLASKQDNKGPDSVFQSEFDRLAIVVDVLNDLKSLKGYLNNDNSYEDKAIKNALFDISKNLSEPIGKLSDLKSMFKDDISARVDLMKSK